MRKSLLTIIICLISSMLIAGCGAASGGSASDKAENVKDEEDGGKDEDKPEKKKKKKSKKKNNDDWESVSEDNAAFVEDIYAPVLEEVRDVVENGYDHDRNYDYVGDGLMERSMYPDGDDLGEVIGYYLHDMNGDGVDELLIGENREFEYGSVNDVAYVYNAFTVKNGKPVSFAEGWARNRQHYKGDGQFFNTGSGGASNTIFGEWHLEPGGTEPTWDDYYFSCEVNGKMAFYHNTSGSDEPGESEKLNITEDEFFDQLDIMSLRIDAIAWTPVGQKESGGKYIVNTMTDDELLSYENKLDSIGYYGFMLSTYDDPTKIDWNEVFYVGAGLDSTNGSPSAKVAKAYLKATGEDEIYTDLTCVSGKDIEEYVKETTGREYSEMKYPLDWVYLKELDLYVNEHGDTNQSSISVKAGMKDRDEITLVYEGYDNIEYCVTFKDKGGKYQFISNLPKWFVEDPTNGGDVDQSAITDGMIIPDSDSRKLTEDDLEGLSAEKLRIARNEIYARYGRRFKDKELQAHFDSMEWYFPSDESQEVIDGKLNEYEKYNADFIGKYEKNSK